MNKDSLEQLQQRLIEFSNARHWEKFHSPKNLSMALSVEVAELLEHFQWLTEEESRKINGHKLDEVKDEVADVLLYLLQKKMEIPQQSNPKLLQKSKSRLLLEQQ